MLQNISDNFFLLFSYQTNTLHFGLRASILRAWTVGEVKLHFQVFNALKVKLSKLKILDAIMEEVRNLWVSLSNQSEVQSIPPPPYLGIPIRICETQLPESHKKATLWYLSLGHTYWGNLSGSSSQSDRIDNDYKPCLGWLPHLTSRLHYCQQISFFIICTQLQNFQ